MSSNIQATRERNHHPMMNLRNLNLTNPTHQHQLFSSSSPHKYYYHAKLLFALPPPRVMKKTPKARRTPKEDKEESESF
jgi:hypothetical protein